MVDKVRVAILDDHQSIIDGYMHRLNQDSNIEVVATAFYGEELEPILAKQPVDVLLLDVHVPTSPQNSNPYPILYLLPKLLQIYPRLGILVISMDANRTLISTVMEAGASGYILKDDQASIRNLATVIRAVANSSIYLSEQAAESYRQVRRRMEGGADVITERQLEALSLCAAYPDQSTDLLAQKMKIANSTMRNLLSGAYVKLNVHNRTAAVARARQLGLITSVHLVDQDAHIPC
jgi:two-component system nitrate/nitrite response regulator NarL